MCKSGPKGFGLFLTCGAFERMGRGTLKEFASLRWKQEWLEVAPDPSTYIDNFSTTLNDLYCNFFPLCTKFITKKRMSKPWITSSSFSLIKQKSNTFQQYRRGLITMRENNLLKIK